MKITIIDNYDSFTYNLAHLVKTFGCEVEVRRNNQFELDDLQNADKLILSPGPGIPDEAGLTLDVIARYYKKKPIRGVCLGHQAIGQYFGAKLENLSTVYHGVQTPVNITQDDYIFRGLPRKIEAGRYHSWVVAKKGLPDCLEVTAESDDGNIMALRHKDYDVRGIQFHPESVLTPQGNVIIQNWIKH